MHRFISGRWNVHPLMKGCYDIDVRTSKWRVNRWCHCRRVNRSRSGTTLAGSWGIKNNTWTMAVGCLCGARSRPLRRYIYTGRTSCFDVKLSSVSRKHRKDTIRNVNSILTGGTLDCVETVETGRARRLLQDRLVSQYLDTNYWEG